MFLAALFTIAKIWKQNKSPSTDARIKKMWYSHTMEHYSTIKMNEILPFATTWVESESRVPLIATPWTVASQAHLSMGFSKAEYWSG